MEHKSLSHNKLAIFRVSETTTLKKANYLITNRLHSTPYSEMSAWRGGGVVAAAYVEGDAEIQAQVKLSVWVRNAFGGRFGVLESDGVGTQEHVESCGVEAQGGAHCGAVGRNGVVCGQTEPFAWLQVGIETASDQVQGPLKRVELRKPAVRPL